MATTYDADGREVPGYVRKNLATEASRLHADPIVAEALECFECSAEAYEATRKSIIAAKNFRALNQWSEQVREQRQGAPAIQGQAAQPARPCLTIDRISGPTRQVSNMVKQSDFGFDVLPNGPNKDTAEVLKGWMRRVKNDAASDEPIEWAADSAAEGGIGWFRIETFESDDDPKFPFDQDVRLVKVKNSLSVYPDPFAQTWYPRRGDTQRGPRWVIQTEDFSKEEFKRRWPKAKMSPLSSFYATGDSGGWITEESVRVADFWKVEYEEVRIVELNNGQAFEGEQIPPKAAKGDKPNDIRRERKKFVPHVMFYKVCATEILEQAECPGTRILFVPIIGEELDVDGKTVLRGVIQPAMDPQRMLNYSYSAAIESAALAPKAPFIVAEGQINNYKSQWQMSPITNYAYLTYTPVSLLGSPVPPPQRNTAEQPIQAFVQLMGASEEALKFSMNSFDFSLGNTAPNERSGDAIEALQSKSDFTNSSYLDNTKRAMTYAADLMLEIAPVILDRPGRVLQILGSAPGDVQHATLNQPFVPGQGPVMHPTSGEPVNDIETAQLLNGAAKIHDLSALRFGVTVTVGRDKTTRDQEEASALGALLPHLPESTQAALTPEYIRNLDFSNSEKMAQIAERSLPPELQAAVNPQAGQLPPQVQAQMASLQQENQQLKQVIDTEQVKAKYQLQREQVITQREMLLANVNNAAKILVAHITAAKEAGLAQDEGDLETKATGIEQWHERLLDAQQKMHDFRMSQLEHQQNLEAAQQAHGHEMAQIAAQPQPEPAGAGA
jgi:hypothetical protein